MADRRGKYMCACGDLHANWFKECPKITAAREAREQEESEAWKARPARLEIIRRPDPLGRQVWGDRFVTLDRQAANVFMHKKEAGDAA